MINNITIHPTEPGTEAENFQSLIDLLLEEMREIRSDVEYIKMCVQERKEKRDRKREKKENRRLAELQEQQAIRRRKIYEDIVRTLRGRPWQFMPSPKCQFSPKELDVVKLLARGLTDFDIAKAMNLKEGSIGARLCAINKRLKLEDRMQLVSFYAEQIEIQRRHRHKRCLVLLSWLLNPPPGYFYHRDINASWSKKLGRSRTYRYLGTYISDEIFNYVRPYELQGLKLRIKGLDDEQIAARLNIRKSTLKSYFSELRSTIKIVAGVTISSNDELIQRFRKHPRLR